LERKTRPADRQCASYAIFPGWAKRERNTNRSNLNSVIEQAVSFTKPKWETQSFAAGSRVRVKIDFRDLPDILGDAARLRDAVTNLIFNALDAMPQGDTLTLRTRAEGDAVLLQVSDIPA
jgi:signal transduction histidine kinase